MIFVIAKVKWRDGKGGVSGFGGLGVPKFAGSNPAEAVRIFQGEKILSTPSFGGKVKPSVPCRRFTAYERSLNGVEVAI